MSKLKPGDRVKITYEGPRRGTIVDHKNRNLIPKPSEPFFHIPEGQDKFYVLPDDTSGLEHCAFYPYLILSRVDVIRIETDSEPIVPFEDVCPDCNVVGEWVAAATKCPKCWKVW